ncbi:MAG: hypothetical protein ACPGUU_04850 [Flavobacteriaceae bacterium]
MSSEKKHKYSELYPSKQLDNFVASYFEAINLTNKPQKITICPDSYFKLMIQLLDGKIVSHILVGLFTREIDIILQPNIVVYAIRFKILAPEYILKRELKSVLNKIEQLELDYFNIKDINFTNFSHIVEQFENILISKIPNEKEIRTNRLRLSQFLYNNFDDIKASEVSNQIYWPQREINRYLSKYLGISLKKYLNIQKCYRSYFQIRDGNFFPEKGFFDQAHFIREVKKHTGKTPSQLFSLQNDQFIQLKKMKKK